MEISQYNSRKISILNMVAIMLVFLIHSYYLEAENYPCARIVQQITGTIGLSSVAVPLFFFISGLLFFKSVNCVGDCIQGIKKRLRTLVLPYIIWNLIFVGWYLVLSFIPGVSRYVNSDILSNLSWNQPLDSLKFLFIEPAGFHLWFLRDLIVFVALTPILYLAIKHYPWISFIVLFLISGGYMRCGIVYFFGGGIISLHYGLDKFSSMLSKRIVIVCALFYLISCSFVSVSFSQRIVANPYYQKVLSIVGILAIWGGYDIAYKSLKKPVTLSFLSTVSKYTFFVYLFHEPAFNIIKKISLRIAGISNGSLIILYLANPVTIATLSVALAMLLKRIMPRMYSVAVGGR